MKFVAKSRPGIAGAALVGVIAMLGVLPAARANARRLKPTDEGSGARRERVGRRRQAAQDDRAKRPGGVAGLDRRQRDGNDRKRGRHARAGLQTGRGGRWAGRAAAILAMAAGLVTDRALLCDRRTGSSRRGHSHEAACQNGEAAQDSGEGAKALHVVMMLHPS